MEEWTEERDSQRLSALKCLPNSRLSEVELSIVQLDYGVIIQ